MEEARPFPEYHLGEQVVHERNPLSGRTPKIGRGQRTHIRQRPKMGTVVLDRANHMANTACQAIEQTSNYCHPVPCEVKLTPFAKGERLVQSNAQNEVGRL